MHCQVASWPFPFIVKCAKITLNGLTRKYMVNVHINWKKNAHDAKVMTLLTMSSNWPIIIVCTTPWTFYMYAKFKNSSNKLSKS